MISHILLWVGIAEIVYHSIGWVGFPRGRGRWDVIALTGLTLLAAVAAQYIGW
jgi:hypothetical protein